MSFESIGPSGRNQKKDGKNKVDPREECIESFKISKKGKKLQSEEGRKGSRQSDLPNKKRLVIPHHRQEPQGNAQMSNRSNGGEPHEEKGKAGPNGGRSEEDRDEGEACSNSGEEDEKD